MREHLPDKRPDPPRTAVVQVADDGTATLYLGTELVEHAVAVGPSEVMRVLVDYAVAIDSSVRVTTQMYDGTWTRHSIHTDGTATSLPGMTHSDRQRRTPGSPERSPTWIRTRSKSVRPSLLVLVALLAVALLAVVTFA